MEGQNGSSYIRVLIVRFKNEISLSEINLFRGAIIHSMENANVLFHNHIDDNKFRYSYPLIQYKRIQGKAAIVCLGGGIDAISDFFSSNHFSFNIGERYVQMEIESIIPSRILIQIWNDSFRYQLRRWLPLNSDNYAKYTSTEDLVEKMELLKHILIGNILSMAKGLGIILNRELSCKIIQLSEPMIVKNKQLKMMSFDVVFDCNLSIPNYIGIGKNASINFGTITRITNI
jgi:hypothetical protein